MENISVSNKDQIVMSLVHYFVTKENYSPIAVQGAKDEIWLENLFGPYRIIRINTKYIHNDEQFQFDIFKVKHVLKQIKKKTLSFKLPTLNICINVADRVDVKNNKDISSINIVNISELSVNDVVKSAFPSIDSNLITKTNNLDIIMNVTKDINDKTEKDNKHFQEIFKDKKNIFTYAIMGICIFLFLLTYILGNGPSDIMTLLNFGAVNKFKILEGEYFRIITGAFLHGSVIHLLVNMYSLYIVGTQVENFIGRYRFLFIYLVSVISGSLLSLVFNEPHIVSVGASGAIFGLLAALLYFGYHYRLYLNDVLTRQIVPIIMINLIIGFSISGIDNAAHIGGLIGGYLAAVIVSVKSNDRNNKTEIINGAIALVCYLAFLIYMVFFR